VLLFMMTTGSFPWNLAKQGDAGFEALLAGELEKMESMSFLTESFAQVSSSDFHPFLLKI
jgi:hypothetical protein